MDTNDSMPGAEPQGLTPEMILNDIDYHTAATTPAIPGERTGEQLRENATGAIPFLVDAMLQSSGLACLAGSSDTGKSALLRQLCTAIATGQKEWLGFHLNARHRSALYVSTEDGEEATRTMLLKQTSHHTPGELRTLRFLFEWEDIVPSIDYSLTVQPADIVIVDCFSDVYGGDLKDTQKIRAFLQLFQTIAERHKCLVMFLHHTGKRTENLTPSKNNLLSGQGFEAKMRLVVELRKDHVRKDLRHLCIVKGNYLPDEAKNESHILTFDADKLTFTRTDERVPYECLAKGYEVDEGRMKYDQAVEMRAAEKSYDFIAEKLGYSSRSSVMRLLEKGKKLGWDAEEESDGEDAEEAAGE